MKNIIKSLFAACLILTSTGCASNPEKESSVYDMPIVEGENYDGRLITRPNKAKKITYEEVLQGKKIYDNFCKQFSTDFLKAYSNIKTSFCLSLQDAFLALGMTAYASDDDLRNAFVKYCGADSIEDILTAGVFLYRKLSGTSSSACMYNSMWIKEENFIGNTDNIMQDLADSFGAYIFKGEVDDSIVDEWIHEVDTGGCLKDVKVPKFLPDTIFASVSGCSTYTDAGPTWSSINEEKYKTGTHLMNYKNHDSAESMVDYIEDSVEGGSVAFTEHFKETSYNSLFFFLPKDDGDIYDSYDYLSEMWNVFEGKITSETYGQLNLSLPYEKIETSISKSLSDVVPCMNKDIATRLVRYDEPQITMFKQNNNFTYDYNGTSLASITAVTSVAGGSPRKYPDTTYDFIVDKPHAFMYYTDRPIAIGVVNEPGYPAYSSAE